MKLRHYTIVMILIMGCLLIATGILAGHSNFGASNGRIFVGMLLVVIGLVLAVLFRRKARHETAVFHSTTAGSAGPRADSASVRPEYTLSVADKSMAESLVKTCACIGRKGGFSPVPVDLAKNDAARMGRVLGDNGGYPRMQAVFDSYRDRGGDPRLLEKLWQPIEVWGEHRPAQVTDVGSPSETLSVDDIEKLEKGKNIDELIAALRYKKDRGVRAAAADALGTISDLRALEPLIATLEDKDGVVRWRAVLALRDIGDSRAIRPLEALAQGDPDATARKASQQALQWLRNRGQKSGK